MKSVCTAYIIQLNVMLQGVVLPSSRQSVGYLPAQASREQNPVPAYFKRVTIEARCIYEDPHPLFMDVDTVNLFFLDMHVPVFFLVNRCFIQRLRFHFTWRQ
jgi:hypothetical protein